MVFRSHITGFANQPQIPPSVSAIVAQPVEGHAIVRIVVDRQVVVATRVQYPTATFAKRLFRHLNHFRNRVFLNEFSFSIVLLVQRQTTPNELRKLWFCRFALFVLDIDVHVAQSNASGQCWKQPVSRNHLVECIMHTVLLPDGHALTRMSRSTVGESETVEIYLSRDIYGLFVVRIAQ